MPTEEFHFMADFFAKILMVAKNAFAFNAAILYLDQTKNVHCFTYHPWTHDKYHLQMINLSLDMNNLFYDKMENLNGFELRLAQFHNPPKSIIKENRLTGYDSFLMHTLLDKLRATYRLNKHYDDIEGVQQDLIENKADISFNAEESKNFMFSFFLTNIYLNEIESYCMLVPKRQGSIINLLVQPFKYNALIFMGVFLSVFTLLWWNLKENRGNGFWGAVSDILQLLILGGIPQTPVTIMKKFLLASFIGFSFFLMSTYKSILMTDIIQSNYRTSEPQTLKDLLRTHNTIKIYVAIELLRDFSIFLDSDTKDNLVILDIPQNSLSENIDDFDSCYILTETAASVFLNSERNHDDDNIPRMYMMKEKLFYTFKSISISSESHLEDKISELVTRVAESGIAKYWSILPQEDEIKHDWRGRDDFDDDIDMDEIFTMDDVKMPLKLYVYFILASVIVFVLEMYVHWLNS